MKGLPSRATTRAVLREINGLRASVGDPPVQSILRGRQRVICGCPVARTLRCGTTNKWTVGLGSCELEGLWQDLPITLQLFVAHFDEGRYPGLVL
jgi:hypothetical protein